jgi:putative nucleotidyltransferase with HDIG domain
VKGAFLMFKRRTTVFLNLLKSLKIKLAKFFGNSLVQKIFGLLIFFSITIFLLYSNFSANQVMLRPDEVAQRNIQSNSTTNIIDHKRTLELQEEAISKVQKVYQEDKYALTQTQNEINQFFAAVNTVIESPEEDQENQVQDLLENFLVKEYDLQLVVGIDKLAAYIIAVTPEDREQIRELSLTIAQEYMSKPLTDEALDENYAQMEERINNLQYSSEAREIIKIVTINTLRPNLLFNKEATDQAIKEARESVQPVQKVIKAGEIIVREGERVTEEQISILEQLGMQRNKNSLLTFLGTGFFVLLTFWLIIQFIGRHYREIFLNDRRMLLIGLIFIITLLISRFLTIITISDQPEINALVGFLAPVAAGSMLIAILLDHRLAYFITTIMALFVGFLTEGNQLFYAITAFVGGVVGILQVSRLSQTSDLAKSGLYIASANIITIITLLLIGGNISINVAIVGMIIGAVNGILSAVLMIGVLPYLESAFSITSMIKLLELSNPNHPLLKRLLLEATGTYHHSLMVGNLAEASAEAVGANPLLVRVGAYYHDIGKIKRPDYFVENQRMFENPHEKIAPALSALIITSHVRDGVEMAREARLPDSIIDFIEQHHGTSLAKYFFNRALQEDPDGQISEEGFRYEGPKPKSKEVALVMLADSVEAAVRSLKDANPENIEKMVRQIIKNKLDDGQLELSELTFKDLDVIAHSFVKILEGVYHKRIEYPEDLGRKFIKRGYEDGDNRIKSAEYN